MGKDKETILRRDKYETIGLQRLFFTVNMIISLRCHVTDDDVLQLPTCNYIPHYYAVHLRWGVQEKHRSRITFWNKKTDMKP